MKLSADLVLHGILTLVECLKTLFHAGVVDAQELVGAGCHVGIPLFRSGKALAGGAKIPGYHNFYEGDVF